LALLCLTGCEGPTPDVGDTDSDADTDVAEVVPPDAQPLRFMLHGGSYADTRSSTRFVNGAHGGRVVTLGATDPSDPDLLEYDAWWVRNGASEAVTLNLTTPDQANADAVVATLAAADAVYLRGGDLDVMLAVWSGTAVDAGLRDAVARGAPIGGTAAGAAYLGAQVAVPGDGGLESWQALAGAPFTLTAGAVGAVAGAVIDTDLAYRGRLGRLVRYTQAAAAIDPAAQGLGLDGQTALLVWEDGTAEVAGQGALTLLRPDAARPDALTLWHLTGGYTVDLTRPDPVVLRPDAVPAVAAPGPVDPWVRTVLRGDDREADRAGAWTVAGAQDPDAWWSGTLRVVAGSGRLPGVTVVPALYADATLAGSRQAATLVALAAQPGAVVLALDLGARVTVEGAQITPNAGPPCWILDARGAAFAGVQDTGWRNPVVEAARLTLTTAAWSASD
jgi:cyanophycinase